MRSILRTSSRIPSALVLTATLMIGGAFAQESQPKPMKHGGMMSGSIADQCKQMMAMKEKMKAEQTAKEESLDRMVTSMNAAKGSAKVAATAAAVSEMVIQRKQMMASAAMMEEHMMRPAAEMNSAMAECPMMKGMDKNMDHKGHQE